MSQLLFMYLCFVRSDAKHAFPVKYTLPIQYLPTDLKVKQEKNIPLEQHDVRHLVTCIYNHVTTHYENVL